MTTSPIWRPYVLLVDDDVRTASTLARMLREDGFDVDVAADGAAAISRFTRDPVPELLITDMTMPFADGIAVARYARSRSPNLPIFVVTGYPVLATKAARSMRPPPIVITKPVDYATLSVQLRSAAAATTNPRRGPQTMR
jgi:CheY-like chemotaxis protein